MKTFKNRHFKKRDYECTNVVACQAEAASCADWVECDDSELEGLEMLYRQAGVSYFGWL